MGPVMPFPDEIIGRNRIAEVGAQIEADLRERGYPVTDTGYDLVLEQAEIAISLRTRPRVTRIEVIVREILARPRPVPVWMIRDALGMPALLLGSEPAAQAAMDRLIEEQGACPVCHWPSPAHAKSCATIRAESDDAQPASGLYTLERWEVPGHE